MGKFFSGVGNDFKEIGLTFKEGDWKTRVSYLIMGFGPIMRKQFARGIAFLAVEVLFILYMYVLYKYWRLNFRTSYTHIWTEFFLKYLIII